MKKFTVLLIGLVFVGNYAFGGRWQAFRAKSKLNPASKPPTYWSGFDDRGLYPHSADQLKEDDIALALKCLQSLTHSKETQLTCKRNRDFDAEHEIMHEVVFMKNHKSKTKLLPSDLKKLASLVATQIFANSVTRISGKSVCRLGGITVKLKQVKVGYYHAQPHGVRCLIY